MVEREVGLVAAWAGHSIASNDAQTFALLSECDMEPLLLPTEVKVRAERVGGASKGGVLRADSARMAYGLAAKDVDNMQENREMENQEVQGEVRAHLERHAWSPA